MTDQRLDFYQLFFESDEWVSEENLRAAPGAAVFGWAVLACLSYAIGTMVAAGAETTIPIFWICAGTLLRLFVILLAAAAFCAFSSLVCAWRGAPRLEGRFLFGLALMAQAPYLLSAPASLISAYFDAFWSFWIPVQLVLLSWSYYLLYRGLRIAAGLSEIASIFILLSSDLVVPATAFLTFLWTLYQIALLF